ncbi:MAG TPA: hypothetical protein VF201_06765 [Nitrolancea sp.]
MTGLAGIRGYTPVVVWALPPILIAATAFLAIFGEELDRLDLAILTIAFSIPFSVVGALIVSRQPGQSVGWVMWIIGVLMVLVLLLTSYGQVSLHGRALPGSATARVIVEVFWIAPVVLSLTLLPLLFPTGKPLSPRWRWIGWLSVAALILIVIPPTIFLWIHRQEFINDQQFHTPVAIEATFPIGDLAVLVCAVASIISLFKRIRRSAGVERQQLKWFLAGAATALSGMVVKEFAPWRNDVNALALMALPVAVGIAILRYRLYGIDLIINRTLVYSTLTAILAGADLLLIVSIEHLFKPVASGSDLVVAGSTLGVAAFVQPLRRRIQMTVDRRFYRHKYDAVRTLEAFSARLRDEIDLDALLAELGGVVQETMQPTHVSLWLSHGEAN